MKKLILILCVLFLFGCTTNTVKSSLKQEPTNTPSPTITPTIAPTMTPTIAPTPIGSGDGILVFGGVNTNLGKDKLGSDQFDIYSIKVDGTELTNLTKNEINGISYEFPVISPDGKRIAYIKATFIPSYGDWEDHYAYEIFIMNINGSNIQKISSYPQFNKKDLLSDVVYESDPSWSPDGNKLAFVSNRHTFKPGNRNYNSGEIYTVDLNTYEITQITKSKGYIQHPTWSYDRQKIAFMSDRTGNWNIFVMNADGSGTAVNITNNKFSNRFPAWSPVANRIVFHSDMNGNEDLYTINSDGTDLIRLTDNPAVDASATWSTDGQWIAFTSDRSGNYDFYLLNLKNNETVPLLLNPQDDAWINWRN